MQIYGFPYAGGSAANYSTWKEKLAPAITFIPLELAGRGERMGEPLYTQFEEAVLDMVDRLLSQLDDCTPYALFGHSMGGRLAFEVSRELARRGHPPSSLIVSGSPAPHRPMKDPPIHALDRQAFIEELIRKGGTPREFFDHPPLIELFMPILRADFSITERYIFTKKDYEWKLSTPIIALYGEQEDLDAEDIASWALYTSEAFHSFGLPGGHFFIKEHEWKVLELLRSLSL